MWIDFLWLWVLGRPGLKYFGFESKCKEWFFFFSFAWLRTIYGRILVVQTELQFRSDWAINDFLSFWVGLTCLEMGFDNLARQKWVKPKLTAIVKIQPKLETMKLTWPVLLIEDNLARNGKIYCQLNLTCGSDQARIKVGYPTRSWTLTWACVDLKYILLI